MSMRLINGTSRSKGEIVSHYEKCLRRFQIFDVKSGGFVLLKIRWKIGDNFFDPFSLSS